MHDVVSNNGFVRRFCASLCLIAANSSGLFAGSIAMLSYCSCVCAINSGKPDCGQQACSNPARERLADQRRFANRFDKRGDEWEEMPEAALADPCLI
jgi:hypothetical protein